MYYALRRMGRGLLAVGAVAAVVVVTSGGGRREPNMALAQAFVLVDEDGKPRASLALDAHGRPELTMLGETGAMQVGLGIGPGDSGHLDLADKRGRDRATLALNDKGELGLLYTDGGRPRFFFSAGADGIVMRANDATGRARLSIDSESKPREPGGGTIVSLRMEGEQGTFLDLSAGKGDSPRIFLGGPGGKVAASLTCRANGVVGLDLLDRNQNTRLQATVGPDGAPHLVLRDEKEKPVFAQPPAEGGQPKGR